MKVLKVGIDIHGVITNYADLFRDLSCRLDDLGHEIHIITGEPRATAEPEVHEAGVVFHKFFSIVDYHIANNTPSLRQDDKGHYWVDRNIWIATKGNYAKDVSLDLHFDDQIEYFEYFPKTCTLIYVPPTNFNFILDDLRMI